MSGAGPLLAKAVGDTNANVMDKAVEALCTYLQKADEGVAARWAAASSARLGAVANRTAHLLPVMTLPPACSLIKHPSTPRCLGRRIAGPAAAVLASKCLKGKPATVARTGEACLLLIELEQQAPVIEAILKAFGDKVPKVVLAAVDILLQAVRCGARGWAQRVRLLPPAAAAADASAAVGAAATVPSLQSCCCPRWCTTPPLCLPLQRVWREGCGPQAHH